ncbi:MAG: DUF4252 domain-containing protein [bacterium]|nr:DUF4252 domain-containing protein [bacterium]
MEARKAAILVLAAIIAGGCMHAPTISGVRYDIEREIDGARFETEREMTLGRLSMSLIRRLVAADENDDALAMLKLVRKVEIGIYETRSFPSPAGGRFTIPRSLRRRGWKTLTTVRDDDGGVWVLFRERKDGSIRELMVGSLDGDELVMVKIRGDVDGMFERLRDEGILALPGIVHTDLDPEEGGPTVTVEADQG